MAGSSPPPDPLLARVKPPQRFGQPLVPLIDQANACQKDRPISRSRRRLKAAIDLSKVAAKVDTKDRGVSKRKKVKLPPATLRQRADLQVLAARRRPAPRTPELQDPPQALNPPEAQLRPKMLTVAGAALPMPPAAVARTAAPRHPCPAAALGSEPTAD